MSATLEVKGLRTHFLTRAGAVKAVDGVDFSVGKGEILGLVGESGSGKSITGFSILGLIDPPGRIIEGSIKFNGTEIANASESSLQKLRGNRIAMIFQDPMVTLNPVLTIGQQMVETLQAHRKLSKKDAEKIVKNYYEQQQKKAADFQEKAKAIALKNYDEGSEFLSKNKTFYS